MQTIAEAVRRTAAMEELARRERIRQAWLAYQGEMPASLATKAGAPDDNVRTNYARVVVDRGVGFLFGVGVIIRVGPEAPPGAQAYLDRAWGLNGGTALLQRLALNGAVCGHAFLKLARGSGRPSVPRLIVLDPATVTVTWKPDDWEAVTLFEIAWHGLEPTTGEPVAFRQRIRRRADGSPGWIITDHRSEGDRGAWHTVQSDYWPYRWPPIVHCQNLPAPNEFWGISDLEPDVIGLCRVLNSVLSNAHRIVRLHAHPKLWGAGFEPDELSLDPAEITILPTRDASLNLLEMHGDLSSSLELYRRIKDALHELTCVPEISAGALNALGRVSGVALRVLYQPLLEKTRTKRLLYGEFLRETSQHMLEMAGFGPDVPVQVEWPNPAPTDPYEEARTAVLYTQLGLPSEDALARIGITAIKENTCQADST